MKRARWLLSVPISYSALACGEVADVGSFTDAGDAMDKATSDAMNGETTDRAAPSVLASDGADAISEEAAAPQSDADSCDGTPPMLSDYSALCGAPPTPIVPFNSAPELAGLVVGEWYRCEGPIQPRGGPVAPNGQNGLEFDLYPGTNQGGLGGLIPSGPPCYGFGGVLAYVGGASYYPVSWAFQSMDTDAADGGQPGIVFQATTGLVVYDQPIFSDQGNRMSLSDAIWNGTYVRIK